ncbi:MAG: hypothetical protein LBK24_01075 [Puniceicoccales bacterium]|jgi:hypothetical protein|nr:hypothetical protein [Puniceicoccales bacterium]
MESVNDIQLRAIEEQKIADIGSALDWSFRHSKGIPTGGFDTRKIASLMDPVECSEWMEKSKLVNDLLSRIDLAQKRVNLLHHDKGIRAEEYRSAKNCLRQLNSVWQSSAFNKSKLASDLFSQTDLAQKRVASLRCNKRMNVREAENYRSAKNYLQQLNALKKSLAFNTASSAAVAQLIQQADNGVEHVDYDNEVAELNDRLVKDATGNHCRAITNPSIDPNVVAIEKSIREEFGVKVNFGDKIDLAQRTRGVCERVKLFGHKLPDEIIFFESPGESGTETAFFEKEIKGIVCNSNVDSISYRDAGAFFVDLSFEGVLFHELGHFNSKLSLLEEQEICPFSEELGKCWNDAAIEFFLTLPKPDSEDFPQRLEMVRGKEFMLRELTPEESHRQADAIILKLNEFIDQAEDCFEKRVAREVSLAAATDRDEFMAEVYCGCMLGKSYSPEIMAEYKRLQGRPFA